MTAYSDSRLAFALGLPNSPNPKVQPGRVEILVGDYWKELRGPGGWLCRGGAKTRAKRGTSYFFPPLTMVMPLSSTLRGDI
jgi:hypothetical protein